MPRIPENEIERLMDEVSVQWLAETSGVELKKAGKDWLGRCRFHDDREASLVVSPAKNLWHCFGCQIGGGPIDCGARTGSGLGCCVTKTFARRQSSSSSKRCIHSPLQRPSM